MKVVLTVLGFLDTDNPIKLFTIPILFAFIRLRNILLLKTNKGKSILLL